jgi:hypothetical protein
MFSIDMGGCDIALGFELLRTLGHILMDFKELTIQFNQEGKQYKLQGITTGSHDIINSYRMENILKKGHFGIIAQIHSFQEFKTPLVQPDLHASSLNIKLIFSLPKEFSLPMEFMIIPFL